MRLSLRINGIGDDTTLFVGAHPTGFCQLFMVVQGTGWVAAEDGVRVELRAGQGAYFEQGEIHSKGSDAGMLAIMVQGTAIAPTVESLAARTGDR